MGKEEKEMKQLCAAVFAVMLLLSGCIVASDDALPATPDEIEENTAVSQTEEITEAPTQAPPSVEEQAMAEYQRILSCDLTVPFHTVSVEEIDQFPELPAGCEAVALTMAINHFGYDLEKTEIADDYLIYGDNFVYSYVGNPREWLSGAGIYPPGLVNTVWNFVSDTGAKLYPVNTSGLSLEELLLFVQADLPVVAWSTYYNNYPIPEGGAIVEDDVVYQWYRNEHCVTLCGYDLDDDTVIIADPVRGKVTLSMTDFENTYDGVGQFSMVMLDSSSYLFPPDWRPPYTNSDDSENEEEN